MILSRLGNKAKLSSRIQTEFPPHKIYIELFFGAGGMFFNKPLSKYNFLNDIDSEVFNLFMIVKENHQELIRCIEKMVIHEDLFRYWKCNEESDPIWKAVRLLFLSNFSLLGKMDTQIFRTNSNTKDGILRSIPIVFEKMRTSNFMNVDFRKVIDKIVFESKEHLKLRDKKNTLIYADPIYLDTTHTYNIVKEWTEEDTFDLFELLEKSGCNFAISEFNHPFVMNQAKRRNLNIIELGERRNLKNKRVEVLITNYENKQISVLDSIA